MTVLAASAENISSDTVNIWAEFVNRYGFMTIFCVVVILVLIAFFINFSKQSSKKQESELEFLNKERNASLEQNQQMFDLVTKVQTEQIIQLQEMTTTLKELNTLTMKTELKLDNFNSDFEKIHDLMKEHDKTSFYIKDVLNDIIVYVKKSEKCTQEILEKVTILESTLMKFEEKEQKPEQK